MKMKRHHFVLVHGSCHGAWCWYKLATLLDSAGHTVTALDMAASGVDSKTVGDVRSIEDYHKPLMDYFSSNSDDRVIIVGHSFGGVGVSLAMEAFPDKIAAAVYVAAMLPSPSLSLGEVFGEYHRRNPPESLLDTKFFFDQGRENFPTTVIFGPNMLSSKLYNNCSPEDVKLANMLVRPSRAYTVEMAEGIQFTEERFGSVPRAYVLCKDDKTVTEDFQRMLIERTSVNKAEEINGADHMVMLSKPRELSNFLLLVAEKFD